MSALGSLLGNIKDYCPDCGTPMKSTGCCSECGYGEQEDDMEEEGDDKAEMQSLLDLRDTLQNALKQVDRMIVGGESSKPKPAAPPQQIVWMRQK